MITFIVIGVLIGMLMRHSCNKHNKKIKKEFDFMEYQHRCTEEREDKKHAEFEKWAKEEIEKLRSMINEGIQ